jgi:hypothetical protein
MKAGVVLAVVVALWCAVANANEDVHSATSLMPGCRDFLIAAKRNTAAEGECRWIATELVSLNKQLGFCTPVTMTMRQVIEIIVTYINGQPARRMHERFFSLAVEALQSAWPCQ